MAFKILSGGLRAQSTTEEDDQNITDNPPAKLGGLKILSGGLKAKSPETQHDLLYNFETGNDVAVKQFGKSTLGAVKTLFTGKPFFPPDVEKTISEHPVASTIGKVVGGATLAAPMAIAAGPAAGFAGAAVLGENQNLADRIATDKKFQPSKLQLAAKLGLAGTTGAVTGQIFKTPATGRIIPSLVPKTAIPSTVFTRATEQALGAGATGLTGDLASQAVEGKAPDIKKSLVNAGLNTAIYGLATAATKFPELRSTIESEGSRLAGKPVDFNTAKSTIEKAGINPEQLSPEFVSAAYNANKSDFIKNRLQPILKEYMAGPGKETSPAQRTQIEDIARSMQFSKDLGARQAAWARLFKGMSPEQQAQIEPFYQKMGANADPVDVMMVADLHSKIMAPLQDRISQTVNVEDPANTTQTGKLQTPISDAIPESLVGPTEAPTALTGRNPIEVPTRGTQPVFGLPSPKWSMSTEDKADIGNLVDWESNMPNGERSSFIGDTGQREFIGNPSGHSDIMQGIGPQESFKLLKKAQAGEKLTDIQLNKVKLLLEDFRANIKPQMESIHQEIDNAHKDLSESQAAEVIDSFKKEAPASDEAWQEPSNQLKSPSEISPSDQLNHTKTLYQGKGKEKSQIYALNEYPVAGKGSYYAFDEKTAKNYGDQVTAHDVNTKDFLTISNDDEWRALTKSAGNKYPNPVGMPKDQMTQWSENIKKAVTDKGYKGLIVNVPPFDREDIGKTLHNVMGHSQVIDYTPIKSEKSILNTPQGQISANVVPSVMKLGAPKLSANPGKEVRIEGPYPEAGTQGPHRLESTELVKMTKQLLGSPPALRKMSKYLGVFRADPNNPKITLNQDIFSNPDLVSGVLAHEIGHLYDFLPDKTMDRGNILGRIASLNDYVKTVVGETPTVSGTIAPKERQKLSRDSYKEAKKLVGEDAPKDVLTKTAKRLYGEKLAELSASRKVINRDQIMGELKKLSLWWKPMSENADPKFVQYRMSSKELYADAISVLLNRPEKLTELAPNFEKSFWAYIDRKPQVKEALQKLQEFLNLPEGERLKVRQEDIDSMFKRGEESFYETRNKIDSSKKSLWFKMRFNLIDRNSAILDKINQAEKQGKIINPDDNPKYYLEEYNYLGGKIKSLLDDVDRNVVSILMKNGLTMEQLGQFMFLDRVLNDRKDIANPLGHNPRTAAKQIDYMKQQLGPQKFAKMTEAVEQLRGINKKLLEKALNSGLIKQSTYNEISTNPAYATFQVLDYLDQYVSPSIIHQVGTLKEIANPFTSTVMKMMSTVRAIERNNTAKATVKFLQENFPAEVEEATVRRFGKYKSEIVPKEFMGTVKTMEEGKLKGYHVDPFIAASFERTPAAHNNAILEVLKWANKSWFRPVFIGLNPGFQAFNLMRDFVRSWKLNPDISLPQMIKEYQKAIPVAKLRVAEDRTKLWNAGPEYKTLNEMEKNGMLSLTYNDLLKGNDEELSQFEYLLGKYNILKTTNENPAWQWMQKIEDMGNMIETIPKVIGYTSRLKKGMNPKELAHEVRIYAGSPDFYRRGEGYDWYNNIFLFSNATKEGIRADVEGAFKNPRTRSGYWWKTVMTNVLPKLAMVMAAYGLFGQRLKDFYGKVTEFNKTNYVILPLGIDSNGNAIAFRIPQDESGRLISAIIWKALTGKSGLKDAAQISNLMAGQVPSMTPTLEMLSAWSQYMVGKNPYDFFRGRNILSDDEQAAGGWYSLSPMLKWTGSQMGMVPYQMLLKSSTNQDQAPYEKVLTYTPVVGRFIVPSNYGEVEQQREQEADKRSVQAINRLSAPSKLKSAFKSKFKSKF